MARTYASDPLQKYKYRVSIPGLPTTVGFNKVSGLTKELGVVEYAEGGYDYTHKLTGKEKTGEVVCEKGMFADTGFEDIFQKSVNNPDFRNTIKIELMDKFGKVAREWTLAEAWVSKWEGSDFDATSEDVAIEKITIQFEHYL